MQKPSLPQGMRDFNAETLQKRRYILDIIRKTFELYGFQPLETPAMENLETLMGKYGEEGDKLIFKVLNNGLNDPKNLEKSKEGFEKVLTGKNSSLLTERALKYDLTIPFARYVAMNHGQLNYPYKRYQIQPVWRADRPQKGRYREFTQCDADVVGSRSLMNEVELAAIYHDVFSALGLKNYSLQINSRKILAALAETCGYPNLTDITVAIDKLDKIGMDKVMEELQLKGLNDHQKNLVKQYLQVSGTNEEKMAAMEQIVGATTQGKEGLDEVAFVLNHNKEAHLTFEPTLARGLNYYTGIIYEAKAGPEVVMGSIGGGGRYDDLTGLFGVKDIPGVGISFGIDRIYDVIESLQLFPENIGVAPTALFFNMGIKEAAKSYELVQQLRKLGISCELYPEASKMDKQFKYAEKKGIRYAVIIGSKEMESGIANVKELNAGYQSQVAFDALSGVLGNNF